MVGRYFYISLILNIGACEGCSARLAYCSQKQEKGLLIHYLPFLVHFLSIFDKYLYITFFLTDRTPDIKGCKFRYLDFLAAYGEIDNQLLMQWYLELISGFRSDVRYKI